MIKFFTILIFTCHCIQLNAYSVTLQGANGVEASFLGVRQATVEGIYTIRHVADGELFIPWSSLNISFLSSNQPTIYKAYKELTQREVDVNLDFSLLDAPPEAPTIDLSLGIYKTHMLLEELLYEAKERGMQMHSARVTALANILPQSQSRDYMERISGQQQNVDIFSLFISTFFDLDIESSFREFSLMHGDPRVGKRVQNLIPRKLTTDVSSLPFLQSFTQADQTTRIAASNYLRWDQTRVQHILNFFHDLEELLNRPSLIPSRKITALRQTLQNAVNAFHLIATTRNHNRQTPLIISEFLNTWNLNETN